MESGKFAFCQVTVMPKGPNGQKRPADTIGLAVMIGKIATGEIDDPVANESDHHRKGGKAGGKARAAALSPEQRADIARFAAEARWKKSKD